MDRLIPYCLALRLQSWGSSLIDILSQSLQERATGFIEAFLCGLVSSEGPGLTAVLGARTFRLKSLIHRGGTQMPHSDIRNAGTGSMWQSGLFFLPTSIRSWAGRSCFLRESVYSPGCLLFLSGPTESARLAVRGIAFASLDP